MEVLNKWEIIGRVDVWADDDGNGMVCPFCMYGGEVVEVDLEEIREDFQESGEVMPEGVLLIPNMGPGGYGDPVEPVMDYSGRVLVSPNWQELGVFACGNDGGVWTADNAGKQLPGHISYGSREWVKDPKEVVTKPWSKFKYLYGYGKKEE